VVGGEDRRRAAGRDRCHGGRRAVLAGVESIEYPAMGLGVPDIGVLVWRWGMLQKPNSAISIAAS